MRPFGLMALAVLVSGCSAAPPPAPVAEAEPTPFQNQLDIPRELGPLGSLQAEVSFHALEWIDEVRQSVRGFHVGKVSYAEIWNVLAEPARSSHELENKAIFVRFKIPHGEVEGGAAWVLLRIYTSGQHAIVRRAAFAALRGIHLKFDSPRTLEPVYHDSIVDSCPMPVLPEHSPVYVQLARMHLRNPNRVRGLNELRWLVKCLLVNENDLPEGFETMAPEFADYFEGVQHDRAGQSLAMVLSRNPGARCGAIITEILERYDDFSPDFLLALLPTGVYRRLPEPLKAALRRFQENVKTDPDARYRTLLGRVAALLKR